MSLWVCSGCSTRYAPGLEACPHCGSAERVEEGSLKGSRLPFLDVACINPVCPAAGVQRRMLLRCPVPGVVEMPHLLYCARCWQAMPAVGGSMEEENMPKITRHGGPTNAAAGPAEGAARLSPELSGEGEQPSVGNSSSTSSVKPEISGETTRPSPRKRARTTASRSKRGRTANSTASSTDTSGEADPASENE